jgi:hypothetical protein
MPTTELQAKIALDEVISAAQSTMSLVCRATCGPEPGRRSSTLARAMTCACRAPMINLGQRTCGCAPWSANCGGGHLRRLDRRED